MFPNSESTEPSILNRDGKVIAYQAKVLNKLIDIGIDIDTGVFLESFSPNNTVDDHDTHYQQRENCRFAQEGVS